VKSLTSLRWCGGIQKSASVKQIVSNFDASGSLIEDMIGGYG